MKITVIGLGHVGLVAAAGLAVSGHDVLATDTDRGRVDSLKDGKLPFYEPGLTDWLESARQGARLSFLHPDEFEGGLGEVAMVAVGTPVHHGSVLDLKDVWSAVSWIKAISGRDRDLTVVMKSTVPPGTGLAIMQRELGETGIGYAANPEFLREGQALIDWQSPDRIVIGTAGGDQHSVETVTRMYEDTPAPIMVTDVTSAEMIKYASNALLATRISFINEIAAICNLLGASIDDVSDGLAMDSRMGSKLYAGVGYGGSCLPKDTRGLEVLAQAGGLDAGLLRAVTSSNDQQRMLPLHAMRERFDGSLAGVRIAVLGLAYKPGTDDVRDAPALDLLKALNSEGAIISAYDPRAMDPVRRQLPESSVRFASSVENASIHAQALVLMTEWPEFLSLEWLAIAGKMDPPRLIFDGRNALEPEQLSRLGFEYVGVGRPNASQFELQQPFGDTENG